MTTLEEVRRWLDKLAAPAIGKSTVGATSDGGGAIAQGSC